LIEKKSVEGACITGMIKRKKYINSRSTTTAVFYFCRTWFFRMIPAIGFMFGLYFLFVKFDSQ